MDAFLKDIDPNLAESIKKDVPEAPLLGFIEQYKGPDTKEDRLQALIPFLTSLASLSERRFGPGNKQRKKTLEVLGHIYANLQDWPAAVSTWKSIVDTDDEISLNDHPERDLAAMFNLGLALNHTKNYPEAEEILVRLLPMLAEVKKFGRSSQQYVGSLTSLMLAVGKQGRVEEARKLYSDHAEIVSQYSEPEYSAHTVVAKAILSEVEHDAREG